MNQHGTLNFPGSPLPQALYQEGGKFGRLFPNLPPHEPSTEALIELGRKGGIMDEIAGDSPPSSKSISAGFTFLGQFIDHDITFDPTSSLERQNDPAATRNFRTPMLELDSVYGAGPDATPYLYDREDPAKLLVGTAENPNDLPRNSQGRALIGDPRNDENLFVSQLQLAFLKFHNAVVDYVRQQGIAEPKVFKEAQRLVRWHYQWIVVHEFLPLTIGHGLVDAIMREGLTFYCPQGKPFIPVEFAVAAYRFGHSQVQAVYRVNEQLIDDLFDLPFFGPISPEQIIDWSNFFRISSANPPQFSRKIDSKLAGALLDLPFFPEAQPEHRSLAVRNLLRGKAFGLPSGQAVAKAMCVEPLSQEALGLPALDLAGEAPLWFYILKEAEIQTDGERLGEVGGRIVGEVLLGLLKADPMSYLRVEPCWNPTPPFASNDEFTMVDLLQFAGVV